MKFNLSLSLSGIAVVSVLTAVGIVLIEAVQVEADETLGRVRTTTALSDLHDADLVIEAVSEIEALKKRIFGELDRVVKPSGILVSNTSSISITRIASYTERPLQVG